MKAKGTERELLAEAATLLNLLRDIRDELRYLRQDVREALHGPTQLGAPDVDEFLSVEQVAAELQVIPPTVRAWIQSGALPASRPGKRPKAGPQVSCSQDGSGRVRRSVTSEDPRRNHLLTGLPAYPG